MVSKSIVSTKLFIPPVRPRYLARERLIEGLNVGLDRKLILVTAPAGYGKTTLMSIWSAQSSNPVTWLSLDERDNDEDRFLTHLVASFQMLENGSDIGKSTLSLRQSPQPPPVQTILTVLINELVRFGDEFVLILDDYHEIDNQEIHDLITTFIKYLPPNAHIIVTSRAVPPLPLAVYRVRNELLELTAGDLKFNEDETEEFLREVMELELPDEELKELSASSEGWAASLQLAALSLRGMEPGKQIS